MKVYLACDGSSGLGGIEQLFEEELWDIESEKKR
jgi:hypothetical protein